MKVGIYSVMDRKGGLFTQPFFAPNDALATRVIYMREHNEPGQYSLFPEDFLLTKIGNFDYTTGHIDGMEHKYDIIGELSTILKPREV